MHDTGQILATNGDRRHEPRSTLARKLLALEVGESFLWPAARRRTLEDSIGRWSPRRGRRWSIRQMLRSDGTVRTLLVKRKA